MLLLVACAPGAILGHGLCTALAVVGGNVLAKRISERVVLVLGGKHITNIQMHATGTTYCPGTRNFAQYQYATAHMFAMDMGYYICIR